MQLTTPPHRAARVAALYDIHGNLPALDAVLAEVRRAGVELVVIGGDVLPGPMPRETLDRLREVEIPSLFIQGNGDRDVLAVGAGAEAAVPEAYRPAMQWVATQLEPERARWIAAWPAVVTVEVAGLGEVLFCHATPRSDTELFTRLTPEARVMAAFAGITAPVVVCGHTHMPFELRVAGIRVLNAGSVGMPFGPPGASWLLLGAEAGVDFRHTPYDLAAAAARIRRTAYPQAAEFADHNVLEPPAAETMLDAFTRASRS